MTYSEENYLKVIYHLSLNQNKGITTNSIANEMESKPSSVTDMVQKLADKGLVIYKKYQGVSLTDEGMFTALMIVRKHRLWEVFLLEKLDFSWDEVHEVAEQLEHIQSAKLVDKLEEFLNFPEFDPHGDPIPKANGEMPVIAKKLLSELRAGDTCKVVAVKDTSTLFLQYLEKLQITIGTEIKLIEVIDFDGSIYIQIGDAEPRMVSMKFAESLFVRR